MKSQAIILVFLGLLAVEQIPSVEALSLDALLQKKRHTRPTKGKSLVQSKYDSPFGLDLKHGYGQFQEEEMIDGKDQEEEIEDAEQDLQEKQVNEMKVPDEIAKMFTQAGKDLTASARPVEAQEAEKARQEAIDAQREAAKLAAEAKAVEDEANKAAKAAEETQMKATEASIAANKKAADEQAAADAAKKKHDEDAKRAEEARIQHVKQ
jgi:hypothetical protein